MGVIMLLIRLLVLLIHKLLLLKGLCSIYLLTLLIVRVILLLVGGLRSGEESLRKK